VNILLDEMVVPELIQNDANSKKIIDTALRILSDKNSYKIVKQKLESVKEKLGHDGASQNAAKLILEIFNES